MFLFLPILIVIVLIQVAVKSSVNISTTETNKTLAFAIVFGLAPLLIAIATYGSHFVNKIKPQLAEKTLWISKALPYIVFVYLLSSPLNDSSEAQWLLQVFKSTTNNFQWLYQYFVQNYLSNGDAIQTLGIVINSLISLLCVFQYYLVFCLYMLVYYFFNQKGSRDYNTPQLVSFIGANRIIMLGFFLVIIYELIMGLTAWQSIYFAIKKFETIDEFQLIIYYSLDTFIPLVFPFFMLLVFPLILPVIAGWKKLEDPEFQALLQKTAKENNFKYNEIYLANTPGLITAGVIGVFPRTTNLFFTRDILNLLNQKEIEAVMLHEIGHSKYKHIIFYLFFIMLIQSLVMFLTFIPGTEMLINILTVTFMVIAIRFAWGWLSRQCERQADLNAAEVQGTPEHLVSSFYKISGRGFSLDKPSWHHGSLRERINNLLGAFQTDGALVRKKFHNHIKLIKTMILLAFLTVNGFWVYTNYSMMQKNELLTIGKKTELAFNSLLNKNYSLSEKYYLKAIAILEDSKSIPEQHVIKKQILIVNYYNLACCYALSGKPNEAIEFLNKTLPLYDIELMDPKAKHPLNVLKVQTDPDLDSIRSMPEYALFIEELKKVEKGLSMQSWKENL